MLKGEKEKAQSENTKQASETDSDMTHWNSKIV